jgi:hypothetical protein
MAATGDQLVVVSKALTRMLQCVLALHDTHALEFSPFMSEFLHHYVDMIIAYDPSQQARHATAPARRLLFVSSCVNREKSPESADASSAIPTSNAVASRSTRLCPERLV